MLPMPTSSSDPHDKPLAARSTPNHPPCLSESLSLDSPRPSAAAASAPAQDSLLIRLGARPYRPTEGFAFSRLPSATRAIGLSSLGLGGGCGGWPNGSLRPAPLKGEARPSLPLRPMSEWDLRRKVAGFLFLSLPREGGTLGYLTRPGITDLFPH